MWQGKIVLLFVKPSGERPFFNICDCPWENRDIAHSHGCSHGASVNKNNMV